MSLKENVTAIKDELTSEEKFFEKLVSFEYLYKKYRYIIWALLAGIIVYFVTVYIQGVQEDNRIEEANTAYATLVKTPDDKKALAVLKEKSIALHDLFLYEQAIKNSDLELFQTLSKSKTFMIADMATYHYAVLSGSSTVLKSYTETGVYFKDLAIVNYAALLIKQTKMDDARNMLSRIAETSPVYEQAQMLGHYGVTKK